MSILTIRLANNHSPSTFQLAIIFARRQQLVTPGDGGEVEEIAARAAPSPETSMRKLLMT